jgi:hypothetical protein
MSLPGITAPPGTPVFFYLGHAVNESSVFATVKMAAGHSRARRKQSVPERIVSVQWQLEAAEMKAVVDWYEDTLKAGALEFSAHVAAETITGLVYWQARWKSFSTELQHFGRGRISGELFLRGEPSTDAPNTSSLAMEIGIALRSIRGSIAGNANLAMEIEVDLISLHVGS